MTACVWPLVQQEGEVQIFNVDVPQTLPPADSLLETRPTRNSTTRCFELRPKSQLESLGPDSLHLVGWGGSLESFIASPRPSRRRHPTYPTSPTCCQQSASPPAQHRSLDLRSNNLLRLSVPGGSYERPLRHLPTESDHLRPSTLLLLLHRSSSTKNTSPNRELTPSLSQLHHQVFGQFSDEDELVEREVVGRAFVCRSGEHWEARREGFCLWPYPHWCVPSSDTLCYGWSEE